MPHYQRAPVPPPPPAAVQSLRHLRQLHARAIKSGVAASPAAVAPLISFAALSPRGSLPYARLLFLRAPHPDLPLFNLMIRAHSGRSPSLALSFFLLLLAHGFAPNHLSFPFLLKACANLASLPLATAAHALAVKTGFSADPFVQSNLLHMYCTLGLLHLSEKIFAAMSQRDVVSVTTMVVGYVRSARLDDARRLFDEMPERDPAAWSAMITGYVQAGEFSQGLVLFDDMVRDGVCLNEAGAVSVLTACAHLGALDRGEWIHHYVINRGMTSNPIVSTALLDMFAKCGKIEQAVRVFDGIRDRNLVSWTVMIKALAAHGMVTEALDCLQRMCSSGIEPDGMVYVGVLTACVHAGLVEEGNRCFRSIPSPGLDHYACMVDLLGRAGLFKEVEGIINEMPMEPDEAVWGAVLNACKLHGNIELGQLAGGELMKLRTGDGGHFVLLANLYASWERWDDVVRVRKMMGQKGIQRLPGWSSIEINGVTHRFVSGDKNHPQSDLIYPKLNEIVGKVRLAGYVEDLRACMLDLDEYGKKVSLLQHSEKLALAFGLMNTTDDYQPIFIIKNLRVCTDCHNFMNLVSLVFKRKIVMRDRTRFHHFTAGSCSCNDYW